MKTKNLELGVVGELLASEFLIKKKYKILEKNWRYKKYEIDLIATKKNFLIFFEVKTRTNPYNSIENTISSCQEKRIISAADSYIKINEIDLEIRFDMIFIERIVKSYKFTHYKEIFYPTFD